MLLLVAAEAPLPRDVLALSTAVLLCPARGCSLSLCLVPWLGYLWSRTDISALETRTLSGTSVQERTVRAEKCVLPRLGWWHGCKMGGGGD